MSFTLAQFKARLGGQLGKRDTTVPNTIRDLKAQEALDEYIGEHPWSWNYRRVTLMLTSYSVSFPTDFNADWEPYAYLSDGTPGYMCEVEELPTKPAGSSRFWFAIDKENSLIKSNYAAQTFTFKYQKNPVQYATDSSQDATALPIPNLKTPLALGVAKYWLAAERDEAEYDRFYFKVYGPLIRRDIAMDRRNGAVKVYPSRFSGTDMGWNRRGR